MADRVLLTGITGFLGGHLARELLAQGYHVVGSLRNPARAPAVRAALTAAGADVGPLDFVTLDLLRNEGWQAAAEGTRFVIHSASPFVTTMPKDENDLIRPAVEGTERALGAALKAGVERVVMTSSTAAIVYGRGKGGPKRLGSDDWPDPGPEGGLTAYTRSKTLAEQRAWALVKGQEARLAVINSGFLVGPLLDDDPGTSGAVVQRFLRGQIPIAPNLVFSCIDVRDAARLHVAALTAPEAAGRRHLAAFHDADIREFGAIIARLRPEFARKMPRIPAPDWFIRLYALFDGDMRANLRELSYRPELDCSRALHLLGRPARPLDETIGAMVDSLVARHLV